MAERMEGFVMAFNKNPKEKTVYQVKYTSSLQFSAEFCQS